MKKATLFALIICLAILSLPSTSSRAQVREPIENKGAAAAWRALLRLRSTAKVLHTTAHPDDEDAALLTWLARNQGAYTALLTLNRGEGGANLIGPELYDALGILRTEELLAAGRYYGLDEQLFTRVTDFGFSKRLDETLEHWGKDVALAEVVRAIRKIRPDVIVSRFHGGPRDGHGNHQAAGLLTREAFKLAADPNVFPEQISKEYLSPWQAKKLYLSCRENEPYTLKIDTGVYDPLLGQTYRELASVGYSMHRSQSVGQARGQAFSYLRLVESVAPKVENEKSIFDGLDTSIVGIAAGNPAGQEALRVVQDLVEMAIREFDARKPWLIVRHLVEGKRQLQTAIRTVFRGAMRPDNKIYAIIANKELDFNQAVNKALGLEMNALVDPPETGRSGEFAAPSSREAFRVAIPGQKFTITASLINPSEISIETTSLGVYPTTWDIARGSLAPQVIVPGEAPRQGLFNELVKIVGPNEIISRKFHFQVPDREKYTRPYWSRASELRDHVYQIDPIGASLLRQSPFGPLESSGLVTYRIKGVNFGLTCSAMTTFIQPPFGEQRRLISVVPAINISISPRVGVAPISDGQTSFNVSVIVSNNVKGDAAGKVKLKLPAGWSSTPPDQDFKFTREGEAGNFTFKVSAPSVATGQEYKIQAAAEYWGREFTEGYRVIAYRDLEPRHLYAPATMDVRGVDVKVAPELSIGYVMGVGDEIPKALEQIGVKVTTLGEKDLANGNLDDFDAIVIGIRATAVRADLKAYSKRLLDYAERGGNLIYQYQTQEFDAAPYGPYPYKLTARAEEVSEEVAKVTIIAPSNPVFNWPNKITGADFDGWVEERGSKWMTTWDERYEPLLECHDREQPPQRGGLLYTQYGKGTFVYAAYAFYRQLPAGVQGAYRLFANLISLKKRPR